VSVFRGRRIPSSVIELTLFGIAIAAWIINGLAGNWRLGAVAGGLLGLVAVAVLAGVRIKERTLMRYIPSLLIRSIVPVAALVWAFQDGRAWFWTIGWLLLAGAFYTACRLEYFRRTGINNKPRAQAIDWLINELIGNSRNARTLRRVRWASVAFGLAALTFGQFDVMKQVAIILGVVAVAANVTDGFTMFQIKEKASRRGPR
jgi:hypothetical protein